MVLRVPSLIEFGSHCLQTSGCTGGFIEFSMKCCSPNAVKGKQPTSEEPCVTGSCYLEMECLPHGVRAPSSSSGQTQEASVSHLLSQPLALLSPQLTSSQSESPGDSTPPATGSHSRSCSAAVAACLLPCSPSFTLPKL